MQVTTLASYEPQSKTTEAKILTFPVLYKRKFPVPYLKEMIVTIL